MSSRRPIENEAVKQTFAAYPADLRERLLDLRELVFSTAEEIDGCGEIVECLKWGQPAYLTQRPKSGSTIRIDALKGESRGYGLFVHCQTRLVPMFRDHYDGVLSFAGNRAIVFSLDEPLPVDPVRHCIAMALTYDCRG